MMACALSNQKAKYLYHKQKKETHFSLTLNPFGSQWLKVWFHYAFKKRAQAELLGKYTDGYLYKRQ